MSQIAKVLCYQNVLDFLSKQLGIYFQKYKNVSISCAFYKPIERPILTVGVEFLKTFLKVDVFCKHLARLSYFVFYKAFGMQRIYV